MRDLAVTRELENVDVSRDIRMDIGGGVFTRIANTRLGTEMDDSVDAVVGKHFGERVGITEVDVDKGERLTVACLLMRNACMLAIAGLLGRELVHSGQRCAATEKGGRHVPQEQASNH